LPFEIRKFRTVETFRESLQICTFAPVGRGLRLTGALMGFAVNWMVVDNINFPDNFPGPVLRHAAKK